MRSMLLLLTKQSVGRRQTSPIQLSSIDALNLDSQHRKRALIDSSKIERETL
jgi:hypothetical protein